MLLAIDVGNTNTVVGLFEIAPKPKLRESFRFQAENDRTGDEYGLQLRALFDFAGVSLEQVHDVIVSSVVPPMEFPLEQMCQRFFRKKPLFVGPGVKTGMPVLYDNPREVGADRIVNAVAAYDKWPQGLIIVDFGTATTFDAVTPKGEYLGGAIAPGIAISMEALFQRASKLPSIHRSATSCSRGIPAGPNRLTRRQNWGPKPKGAYSRSPPTSQTLQRSKTSSPRPNRHSAASTCCSTTPAGARRASISKT